MSGKPVAFYNDLQHPGTLFDFLRYSLQYELLKVDFEALIILLTIL